MDLLGVASLAGIIVLAAARSGLSAERWMRLLFTYAALGNLAVAEFAYLYWSRSQVDPSAFGERLTKVDAAYFSWATASTAGYGDIVPLNQFMRLAVTTELVLSVVAVAGGLAVLLNSRRSTPSSPIA